MNDLRLDVCEGPECPRCGCQDVEILRLPVVPLDVAPDGVGVWFTSGRALCHHCRTEFCFKEVPKAAPPPVPVSYQEPPPLYVR